MARRRRFDGDPLADQPPGSAAEPASSPATVEPPAPPAPARDPLVRGRAAVMNLAQTTWRTIADRRGTARDRERNAVGGRLEIWGGDFGRRTVRIELFGAARRMGFVLGPHEFIDLEAELASIVAWADDAEHPILATIGWGWTFATVAGPPGAIIGGGLRLLHPRSMIFEIRLQDGRSCVGRTDRITVDALDALAQRRKV